MSVVVGAEDLLLVALPLEAVARAAPALTGATSFVSLTVDDREATLVLPALAWQTMAERFASATVAGPYRLVTFDLPLDLGLVGFLAAVARALAERSLPLYALSAFSRDHLLARSADAPAAAGALAELRRRARRVCSI